METEVEMETLSGKKIKCGNSTHNLKISDENIKKWKNLKLFGEVIFAYIANRDMDYFGQTGRTPTGKKWKWKWKWKWK